MIGDPVVTTADYAAENSEDYSVITVWERPGPFRRLLRRLHIDRSTWEYKIVSQETL